MRNDVNEDPSHLNSPAATVAVLVDQFRDNLDVGLDHETAIGDLRIPDDLTDQYQDRNDQRKDFDAMVRAFLYAHVTGRSFHELERVLDDYEDLRHLLGFDADFVSRATFSYAKRNRFTTDDWEAISEAGEQMLEVAIEHGVRREFLADGGQDSGGVDEARLKKMAVRRARDLVFGAWTTDRSDNAHYTDEDHIRQAAYMAMADSGTPSGSRRHDASNGEAMSGNTHLNITKRYRYPDIVQCFHSSVQVVYDVLKLQSEFVEPTTAAVDVTPYPYWGDPRANVQLARMTSGMRAEKQSPYALKFATITTAGDTIPIILGVVTVQERSPWGGRTYPMDKQVDELLEQATRYVSVALLLMDREYDARTVARLLSDRDVTFLTPLSSRRAHQEYHVEYMRRMGIHVDVEPWRERQFEDGKEVATYLFKHLYVPSTKSNSRTTVFRTNNAWIGTDTAEGFANRYRNRWDVENQYKTIKHEFLVKTTSREWIVRAFYFYLGCALQNAWRLADFYYQDAHRDREYDGSPELTAGEFVDLAAKELSGLFDEM